VWTTVHDMAPVQVAFATATRAGAACHATLLPSAWIHAGSHGGNAKLAPASVQLVFSDPSAVMLCVLATASAMGHATMERASALKVGSVAFVTASWTRPQCAIHLAATAVSASADSVIVDLASLALIALCGYR